MSQPSTPRAVAKAVGGMYARLNIMADALESRDGFDLTDAYPAVNLAISALWDAYLALDAVAREGSL